MVKSSLKRLYLYLTFLLALASLPMFPTFAFAESCVVNNVGWTINASGTQILGVPDTEGSIAYGGALRVRVEPNMDVLQLVFPSGSHYDCMLGGSGSLHTSLPACPDPEPNNADAEQDTIPVITVKFPDGHEEQWDFSGPVTVTACGSEVTISSQYVNGFGYYISVKVF